jgi:hypothetical protein
MTNTQTAGVVEGGTRVHGDYLVILRRGRLFVTSAADADRFSDAFGDGIEPGGVGRMQSRNTIIVIGYSPTAAARTLRYRPRRRRAPLRHPCARTTTTVAQLREPPVGDKPCSTRRLNLYGDPLANFPAMRQWMRYSAPVSRHRPATRIYRTDDAMDGRRPHAAHGDQLRPRQAT